MSKTNESSLKSSESVPPPVCAMCLENLPGQNDYCKTSCGHEFHLSCMLTYTVKKGALRCVEATSVMCPLCRKELHNIPRDIDRCLSRFSSLSGFSFDGSTAAVAAPSFPFGASTTAAPAPAVASSTTIGNMADDDPFTFVETVDDALECELNLIGLD